MATLETLLCAEVARQLAQRGAVLRIPAGGDLLWRWFVDLSRARTYGPLGPNPLGYNEFDFYARATGWPLRPRDIQILRAMDDAWLQHVARKLANSAGGKVSPHISQTPITGGMFDALFG